MVRTMNLVKPPRITALQDLHDAEDRGPFSILIELYSQLEQKMSPRAEL